MKMRALVALAVAALTVGALAGCNPGTITDAGTETPTPKPTDIVASPTPTPDPVPVFAAPADCHVMVGAQLEAQFGADGIELFNSTNGEGMFADGSIESYQTGTPFSCVWGVPYVDLNSFLLETQGLTPEQHATIESALDGAGFDRVESDGIITYSAVGDETGDQGAVSLIHVVRADSWITGRAAIGGQQRFDSLAAYLATVGEQVYPAP